MVLIANDLGLDYLTYMLTDVTHKGETEKKVSHTLEKKRDNPSNRVPSGEPADGPKAAKLKEKNHSPKAVRNLNYPIIVHSHLRWDGVWQRPQQFLSRLSKKHPVLFVEGPLLSDTKQNPEYRLFQASGYPNVTVQQTEFPASRFHDGAWVDAERFRLLQDALQGPLKGKFDRSVQWFYDPMAATPFAGKMNEIAIVYDCMDELSQFRFAPSQIIERERYLLDKADVVFAGGRKLHHSKCRFNENCHFYGCGVDVEHFSKAHAKETSIPEDVQAVPHPILGYFGVVDERLNYALLNQLANFAPNLSVVIIGPFAKIDPSSLPRHPRIYWLGRKGYDELPNYVKAFDVCLMPFALNEATEFINPTKALEYMAAGKPIVSSAVPDVVSNFNGVVKIASSEDEFIALCQEAALCPDKIAIERGLQMATANRWETIVQKLEGHIDDALAAKRRTSEAASQLSVPGPLSLSAV